MTILITWFADWSVRYLELPGGDFGMLSLVILIGCVISSGIGFITVLLFKESYYSIYRIAFLFLVINLFIFIISGTTPFSYFSEKTNPKLLNVFLYLSVMLVFLLVCVFHYVYLKTILFFKEKDNIDQ